MNSLRTRRWRRSSAVRGAERLDAAAPEDLAEHGRVLQQLLLGRVEQVEPRSDDALHRVRQLRAGGGVQHPCVLLGIEGIAAGLLEQRGPARSASSTELPSSSPRSSRRVVVGERRQGDRMRVETASAPRRAPFEQLRPRRAEDEQRDVVRPVDEMLDEVERAVVRPVQILEHQDQRVRSAIASIRRCQAANDSSRPPELAAPGRRAGAGGLRATRVVASVREQLEGGRGLSPRDGAESDSSTPTCARSASATAPNGAAAVRERPSLPPVDEVRLRRPCAEELPDEAALPHARRADERHELRRPLVTRALEGVASSRSSTSRPTSAAPPCWPTSTPSRARGTRAPATPAPAPPSLSPRPALRPRTRSCGRSRGASPRRRARR